MVAKPKPGVNPDAVRKRLQDLIGGGKAHEMVNVLPQTIQAVIEHEMWQYLVKPDGKPFASLREFLVTYFPDGCGVGQNRVSVDYGQLMELCRGFPTVLDVLAKNAPKGKRGGDRKSEKARTESQDQNLRTQVLIDRNKGATKTATLQARLAEERPEVWVATALGRWSVVLHDAPCYGTRH